MSAEKTRANLMARVLLLEVLQDILVFLAQATQAIPNLFTNLSHTAKIAEIDAAKQYRALTGTAVREVGGALLGPLAEEDRG